jgi:hypothetical protein
MAVIWDGTVPMAIDSGLSLSTLEKLSCSYGVRLSKSAPFLQNGKASVHRACRSC